jgi:hypothetical protein
MAILTSTNILLDRSTMVNMGIILIYKLDINNGNKRLIIITLLRNNLLYWKQIITLSTVSILFLTNINTNIYGLFSHGIPMFMILRRNLI